MIDVRQLSKHFDSIVAVDQLSFSVRQGEVLGFLGPNGAGKSTTMKMLTCFLQPTSGTATVCGYDILRQPIQVRQSLGYLAENAPLYGEMLVADFLRFLGGLRGLPNLDAALERVVQACSLQKVYYQTIETLSKGYKRRVGLAGAILHDPKVLILDEPTDGLDPNQKFDVRNLILSMASDKCIVLSTHILEEVDAVCTRAIIIAQGRLKFDGTPRQLRERAPDHNRVRIRLKQPVTDDLSVLLGGIDGVARVEREAASGDVLVHPRPGADPGHAVERILAERGIDGALEVYTGKLDSSFRQLTAKS